MWVVWEPQSKIPLAMVIDGINEPDKSPGSSLAPFFTFMEGLGGPVVFMRSAREPADDGSDVRVF